MRSNCIRSSPIPSYFPSRLPVLKLPCLHALRSFSEQVVIKLFYAVRRVVDEAGRALPQGSAVGGLLFAAERYDPADTIGQVL